MRSIIVIKAAKSRTLAIEPWGYELPLSGGQEYRCTLLTPWWKFDAASWILIIDGDFGSAFAEGPQPTDVFVEEHLEDGWTRVLTV